MTGMLFEREASGAQRTQIARLAARLTLRQQS